MRYATANVAMEVIAERVPMDELLGSAAGNPKKAAGIMDAALKQYGIRMTGEELNWLGRVAAEASGMQNHPAFAKVIALEMLKEQNFEQAYTAASRVVWQQTLDWAMSSGAFEGVGGLNENRGQEIQMDSVSGKPAEAIDTEAVPKYDKENGQKVWGYGSGEMGDHKASEQIQEGQTIYANQSLSRMAQASDTNNDWSNATARQVSKDEKEALISYAAEKGVMIPELKQFDGDPTLLKAEIDALSNIRSEFPVGKKVILSVTPFVFDEDFASTYNGHIKLNAKVLRNRTITEQNIRAGGMFAVSKLEDIVVHEYGHIIADARGNRGLEFAKKAYYNLTKIDANWGEILDFLEENISVDCKMKLDI